MIPREELGKEVVLTLMKGEKYTGVEVIIKEFTEGERIGYTDGSRREGVAAAAMAEGGIFLGELATVMDAEVLGTAGAWEEGYQTVASHSQAAIMRCRNLTIGQQARRS